MGTEHFLNALRRFSARRGTPESITCDNAPTFLLSAEILATNDSRPIFNVDVTHETSKHEIHWKHITPYAPWQGGFYERLIKSIKHALYKALRGTQFRSFDHLLTMITEIEATLNTQPLTYQGAAQEEFSMIRPIDFLQHNLNLTLPLQNFSESATSDPEYIPPGDARTMQTRYQAEEAL
ncbi:hypothetical protein Aduo_015379 [Ancylostoma duodenale]